MKQGWRMSEQVRLKKHSLAGFRRSVMLMAFAIPAFAVSEPSTTVLPHKFLPSDSLHASWVFSGIVSSERGEDYGYFFQLQRDNTHVHAHVALMDQSTNTVLFQEDSEADIDNASPNDWHVGRSFLQFNPVNESWIFGVKPKHHLGFNFKVDMIKQFEETPSRQHHLRPGVKMMVTGTNGLNGHILTGTSDSEQFVTTKSSWFRQIWQDDQQAQLPELSSVLCQFNDGSRFYAINLKAKDAQSGAIAGLYNAEGQRQAVSQFIQINKEEKAGFWHIESHSPRLDLTLKQALEQSSVVAGFINDAKKPGFCLLDNQQPYLVSELPKVS